MVSFDACTICVGSNQKPPAAPEIMEMNRQHDQRMSSQTAAGAALAPATSSEAASAADVNSAGRSSSSSGFEDVGTRGPTATAAGGNESRLSPRAMVQNAATTVEAESSLHMMEIERRRSRNADAADITSGNATHRDLNSSHLQRNADDPEDEKRPISSFSQHPQASINSTQRDRANGGACTAAIKVSNMIGAEYRYGSGRNEVSLNPEAADAVKSTSAADSVSPQQCAGRKRLEMPALTASALKGHEHQLTAGTEALSAQKFLKLAHGASAAASPLAQNDGTAPGQHGARSVTELRSSESAGGSSPSKMRYFPSLRCYSSAG
jgi:hypothetical protein